MADVASDPTRFQFTTASVPRAYDEILVPRMFDPWADILLADAALRAGEAILDVGCGPGTVARKAALAVGATGRITGIDVSGPMLAVARSKPSASGAATISYVEADAGTLPFPDGSFDVVTCQQVLQFLPDRPAALREMQRVLRPTGRLHVAVWGTLEECTFYGALVELLHEVVPTSVASLLAAPFTWRSAALLEEVLHEAGFVDVHATRRERPLVFEGGIGQALTCLEATPLWPHLERDAAVRERLAVLAETRLARFLDGGAVRAPLVAYLGSGARAA